MIDQSLNSLGAKVVLASSSDDTHCPENIIDGAVTDSLGETCRLPEGTHLFPSLRETCTENTETFWMSTGMYPQEFIVALAQPSTIAAVTLESYNVKTLKIERNTSDKASHFEPVTIEEFEHTEGHLQSNTIALKGARCTHLRFIISSGYDHFVSVHRVTVES